jgi:hypothetical protein
MNNLMQFLRHWFSPDIVQEEVYARGVCNHPDNYYGDRTCRLD